MEKSKELVDISWQVTEQEYRRDKAISYSMLSTYTKKGFKGLKESLDGLKLATGSIRHGSIVDTLLTDESNFNNLYIVSNYNRPSDIIRNIIDELWNHTNHRSNTLEEYGKLYPAIMLQVIDNNKYGGDNWKTETKINKIIEGGSDYYKLLHLTKDGKELVHQDDYNLAIRCVETLKRHKYTSWIFDTSNPNIKIYYQLKFKVSFGQFIDDTGTYNLKNNLNPLTWKEQLLEEDTIRCMFDIIVVDYDNKIIYPVDLKTTSYNEENFDKGIQDWYYDIR